MYLPKPLRDELDPSETVLWAGQPKQGLHLDLSYVPNVVIALLPAYIAAIFVWIAFVERSVGSALVAIPIAAVAAFLVFGRAYVERRRREATYYALTDSRILIITGGKERSIRSLELPAVTDVTLTETRSGIGRVDFGPKSSFEEAFVRMSPFGLVRFNSMNTSSFQLIENPRRVYDAVMGAKRAASARVV